MKWRQAAACGCACQAWQASDRRRMLVQGRSAAVVLRSRVWQLSGSSSAAAAQQRWWDRLGVGDLVYLVAAQQLWLGSRAAQQRCRRSWVEQLYGGSSAAVGARL